ncbi:hypothetical protein F4810DRAFT_367674 [Camillea tinctor]|nr:hypothetical protein F4810DRAFT_367674 [Camillea tinctor]
MINTLLLTFSTTPVLLVNISTLFFSGIYTSSCYSLDRLTSLSALPIYARIAPIGGEIVSRTYRPELDNSISTYMHIPGLAVVKVFLYTHSRHLTRSVYSSSDVRCYR